MVLPYTDTQLVSEWVSKQAGEYEHAYKRLLFGTE